MNWLKKLRDCFTRSQKRFGLTVASLAGAGALAVAHGVMTWERIALAGISLLAVWVKWRRDRDMSLVRWNETQIGLVWNKCNQQDVEIINLRKLHDQCQDDRRNALTEIDHLRNKYGRCDGAGSCKH